MTQSHRCQFESCQRTGKEKALSYYQKPGQLITIHVRLCDEHFRDLPKSNGPTTMWLKRLRVTTNGPTSN
jgi:hypothetical protein